MFERYSELSRRVIFFARYEASHYGSSHIDPEHLLLALLREMHKVGIHTRTPGVWFRAEIEKRITINKRIPTSVEIPIAPACKQALAFATEEAEAEKSAAVAPQHLLLGLLRVDNSMGAELLRERGITLEDVRKQCTGLPGGPLGASLENVPPAGGNSMSALGEHALRTVEALLEGLKGARAISLAEFFDQNSQAIDIHGKRWVGEDICVHGRDIFALYSESASYRIEHSRFALRIFVATILWQTPAAASPQHRMTIVMAPASSDWIVVTMQLTTVAEL